VDRFACLLIQDLPLAAALRAEPELAERVAREGKRVAIVEPREKKGRAPQSPTILAGFLRGLTVAQARAAEPDLVVRAFSLEGMRSAEQALVDVAGSIGPRVMVAAPGLVFIDLAGTQRSSPPSAGC
jgi:hypothetical protein